MVAYARPGKCLGANAFRKGKKAIDLNNGSWDAAGRVYNVTHFPPTSDSDSNSTPRKQLAIQEHNLA